MSRPKFVLKEKKPGQKRYAIRVPPRRIKETGTTQQGGNRQHSNPRDQNKPIKENAHHLSTSFALPTTPYSRKYIGPTLES
jgi:hypothetical protein